VRYTLVRRRVVVGGALAAVGSPFLIDATAQTKEVKRMKDIRFVVFHKTGPRWLAGKTLFEQPGVMDHIAHYKKLLEAGKLALGGPHVDDAGGGMMIPAAGVTESEIAAFAAEDPAVMSGLLTFEVRPWLIGMSA
jgi:uncharacterized protein YciI